MIEHLVLAAVASTAATAPIMRRTEDSVIVRREQSASTEQGIERLLGGLLIGTVTTYQAVSLVTEDVPFVSPVISSSVVKARLKIGGQVGQPPIDFDDIVYFDE